MVKSEKEPLLDNKKGKKEKPAKRNKSGDDFDVEGAIGLPKKKARQESSLRVALRNLWVLGPALWPSKSFGLQLSAAICFVILVVGRVVNLYVPLYNKDIVNSLTPDLQPNGSLTYRWDLILIYAGIRTLQGSGISGGLLNAIRILLWVKVQQYTTRAVQLRLFSHLHSLPLRWHLSRKTGEVLRVMDRGTQSVNQLLNIFLYQIVPTIADIFIAIIYFLIAFNYLFAIIIFLTMVTYLGWWMKCHPGFTVGITEWRTKFRRRMNAFDNTQRAKAVDSLLNFETVKYYNNEDFEQERYKSSIMSYQASEYDTNMSLAALNTAQAITIALGLLAGCMLCAWFVVVGRDNLTVGDYVLFTTYLQQLYTPLNMLGTFYSMIQQNLVDMENMCELLEVEPEIVDRPKARPLKLKGAQLEFRNVHFHYIPEKPVLKGVSFNVPPGKKLALVGPSGSGKSTIIRLLFRFYDVNDGTIYIDNQDVRAVQQKSLRAQIGVVPQDTVLFNDTIRYNVRYGRVHATDSEVIDATSAADIHHRITSFPEGYETNVGERGLKLSGGEKQRVAIARTLLKAPALVLLDEATSALDTQTERNIQASLARVCAGRTTVIVAHRLSTIVDCDEIIVLKDGYIVERGTHDGLLAQNGMYANMWSEQQSGAGEANALPERPASSALTDSTKTEASTKSKKSVAEELEEADSKDERLGSPILRGMSVDEQMEVTAAADDENTVAKNLDRVTEDDEDNEKGEDEPDEANSENHPSTSKE